MNNLTRSKQLALQFCDKAEQHIKKKQWKIARYQCLMTLKHDPSCATAYKILGVIYQAQNQLTIAKYYYIKALEIQPDFAEVYIKLGSLYTQKKDSTAALKAYQRAIKLQPNFAEAYQKIARIFIQLNQLETALNKLNQALPFQSSLNLEVDYITMGDLFTQQQQLYVALNCYQQAIKLNPDFFKSYHKLASVLVKLERWQEAVIAYQTAIEINPDFCWSYNGLGQAFVQLKQWQEAVIAYQTAIEINPDFCWSYYHLGKAYIALEQWSNAAHYWEQGIKINPDIIQFYPELITVYIKIQAWEKAITTLQSITQLDLIHLPTCLSLVESLINLERWQDVVTIYHKIVDLNFSPYIKSSDWTQFGKACVQAGEFEQAITCYQQAIDRQPHQPWLYTLLADALQKDQQLKAAIDTYNQAINLGLNDPWILTNLGDLYTQTNQLPAATTAYQQASYQKITKEYPEFINTNIILKSNDFPNFLIIGSSKCGTTSLYHNIIEHPQILPALKKEINFWHDDLKQGLNWYRAHFLPYPQTQHYLTGEASPHYLDLQETAQRVFQFCPQMKLIILLRNPVQRAISHYHHWLRLGLEHRNIKEVIQTELDTINYVLQFPIQYQRWYQSINYIARGAYIGFIQQWMAIFPPEQFLILSCENLAAHPEATMKQVFTFLGLPDLPTCRYTQLNVGHYPPLSPSLFQLLSDFYQPYNQQLEEYLGNRFDWN
ncbi:MAG: tetratricopeptide repeat protein [Microcoleaceae cyanobacterium]